MRRFWQKRRPSPEQVRQLNHTVSPKDAYRVFTETVRKCDYFKSWRKNGPKRFKETQSDFARVIDLIYADKWSRVVGLCATLEIRVEIKSDITSSFFCDNAKRDGDNLIYNFDLKPAVGVCRFASMDDSWRIAEGGLNRFVESLHSSLNTEVVPWLERCSNAKSLLAWMDDEAYGKTRWPLMLTLGKIADVRRELREILGSVPKNRMREREIDWYGETGILSKAEAKELTFTNMQIEETYIHRMKALAISMGVSG